MSKAKYFSSTFQCIDDLLSINNPYFESEIGNIYPPEIVLKKTTESANEVTYLDIHITVSNGLFSTRVYDKTESFNFLIVNYPFMSSNIPSGPAYGIYVLQLVRIGRICNNGD